MGPTSDVDPVDYFRILWRGKWIALTSVLIALAIALALLWTRPILYSGTVSYAVEDRLCTYAASNEPRAADAGTSIAGADNPNDTLARSLLRVDVASVPGRITMGVDAKTSVLTIVAETRTSRQQLAETLHTADMLLRDEAERVQARAARSMDAQLVREVALLAREKDLLLKRASSTDLPADERPFVLEQAAIVEARLVRMEVRLGALREVSALQLAGLEALGEPRVTVVAESKTKTLIVAALLGGCAGGLASFALWHARSRRDAESRVS